TRIQLQKFKYDIRPKFIISQSSGKAFCIDSKSDWSIHYQMELIDNAAFDIWLVTVSGFENSTVLVKRQLENFSPGRKFEILNGMLPKEEIQRQIAIRVYFKDEAENQYYQLLHGDIRDLQIDVPIEVAKRKSLIARWLFK
ncbi:MAG: hypothetical protein ACXVI9_11770, partial [Mucilaginibacter sp.]